MLGSTESNGLDELILREFSARISQPAARGADELFLIGHRFGHFWSLATSIQQTPEWSERILDPEWTAETLVNLAPNPDTSVSPRMSPFQSLRIGMALGLSTRRIIEGTKEPRDNLLAWLQSHLGQAARNQRWGFTRYTDWLSVVFHATLLWQYYYAASEPDVNCLGCQIDFGDSGAPGRGSIPGLCVDTLYGDIDMTTNAAQWLFGLDASPCSHDDLYRAEILASCAPSWLATNPWMLVGTRRYATLIKEIAALSQWTDRLPDVARSATELSAASHAIVNQLRSRPSTRTMSDFKLKRARMIDLDRAIHDDGSVTTGNYLEKDWLGAYSDAERTALTDVRSTVWRQYAIRENASDVMSFLDSIPLAQVTGFVTNPTGANSDSIRSFRQFSEHIRVPYISRRDSDDALPLHSRSAPASDRERQQRPGVPLDAERDNPAHESAGEYAYHEERRFRRVLDHTWPVRSGVSTAVLRRLFSEARPVSPLGPQPTTLRAVIVPDGEVAFFFFLTVLAVAKREAARSSDPATAIRNWLDGEPQGLRTWFAPEPQNWRDNEPPPSFWWDRDRTWRPGSFRDLVEGQLQLIRGASVSTPYVPEKCSAFLSFLRSVDESTTTRPNRHAICSSVGMDHEATQLFDRKFVKAVQHFLGSFCTAPEGGRFGSVANAAGTYLSDSFDGDRLEIDDLQRLQRADYMAEMTMRVRFAELDSDGEPCPGETKTRTLFFLPIVWEFDERGSPDIPMAFLAGTLFDHEIPGIPDIPSRISKKISMIHAAVGPLLDAVIMQVMVAGLQQVSLTERERSLRRQISHTMHSELLYVRSIIDLEARRALEMMEWNPNRSTSAEGRAGPVRDAPDIPIREVIDPNDNDIAKVGRYVEKMKLQNNVATRAIDAVKANSPIDLALALAAAVRPVIEAVDHSSKALGEFSSVTRALTRLSERDFMVVLKGIDGLDLRDSHARLDRVVSNALCAQLVSVLGRCSGQRKASEGLRFAQMLNSFPSLRVSAAEPLRAARVPVAEASPELVLSAFRSVFGDSLSFSLELEGCNSAYFEDSDSRNIFVAMLKEMLTNALKALRVVEGRAALGLQVHIEPPTASALERSDFAHHVRFVEMRNTTGPDQILRLRDRKLLDGGQGLVFLAECAQALSNTSGRLGVAFQTFPDTLEAVVRISNDDTNHDVRCS